MRHAQHHALRRLIWRPSTLDLLVRAGLDCGWCDGGCAVAAEGLYAWLHASGVDGAVAIVEYHEVPGLAQHLVAVAGPYYLDADGIRRKRALMDRMRREGYGRHPYLVPARARIGGIVRDSSVSADLAHLLMQHLGPYLPS